MILAHILYSPACFNLRMDRPKNNSSPSSLGARVRSLRVELGLSQGQLAALMPSVKQQSIDQLEQDKVRRPHYLPELALCLNTSLEFLVTGKKVKSKKSVQARFNHRLLADVVSTIEIEIAKSSTRLSHHDKAKLIATVYDLFVHETSSVSEARLHEVTRGIIQFARYDRKGR